MAQEHYEQSLERLEAELATRGSPRRKRFVDAIGLEVEPRAGRLLELIHDVVGAKDNAPEQSLSADLFADDLPGLDPGEVARLIETLVRLGALDRRTEPGTNSDLPLTLLRVDPIVARVALS